MGFRRWDRRRTFAFRSSGVDSFAIEQFRVQPRSETAAALGFTRSTAQSSGGPGSPGGHGTRSADPPSHRETPHARIKVDPFRENRTGPHAGRGARRSQPLPLLLRRALHARLPDAHRRARASSRRSPRGNLRGSARTILDANILGASCARVCPTEVLCEGACVHERPAAQADRDRPAAAPRDRLGARRTASALLEPAPRRGERVAIIGAGPRASPARRSCARLGYESAIFDAGAAAGRAQHLRRRRVQDDARVRAARSRRGSSELGVEIRYAACASAATCRSPSSSSEFDAVFIGVGLGKVRDARHPGRGAAGRRRRARLHRARSRPIARAAAASASASSSSAAATRRSTRSRRRAARRRGGHAGLPPRRRRRCRPTRTRVSWRAKVGCRFVLLAQPVRVVGEGSVEGVELVAHAARRARRVGAAQARADPGSEFVARRATW